MDCQHNVKKLKVLSLMESEPTALSLTVIVVDATVAPTIADWTNLDLVYRAFMKKYCTIDGI